MTICTDPPLCPICKQVVCKDPQDCRLEYAAQKEQARDEDEPGLKPEDWYRWDD